jgi:anti-sigma28 factor (negative regulator of flagellin synthesis)
MRINDLNLTGAAAAETGRAQGSQAVEKESQSRGPAGRKGSGADQVEFSSLSRTISSDASSRNARVQQLAAQYQAGQYQVDPMRVGQAMLSESIAASASKTS